MSSDTLTATGYINHHLQNLTFGQLPGDRGWGLAHTASEAKAMGFWAINVDTMFWSIALGVLFLWVFRKAARRATAETPTGLLNFVEWVIEFISKCGNGIRTAVAILVFDALDALSEFRVVGHGSLLFPFLIHGQPVFDGL